MTVRAGSAVAQADASHDAVCVWHYPLDVDGDATAACADLLDAEERARAGRFRFEIHRRRFVAGRGTLRRILARHAGCDPRSLRFSYGDYGKPSLAYPDDGGRLQFSVSNSGGLGAVAVARGGELGLDIEELRPNADHELIAQRAFAAEERAWLSALPEAQRLAGFYALWTCKEAYLKGRGVGLSAALDRFAVALDAEWAPRLLWSGLDGDDPQRWSFSRMALLPGYSACLAVAGCGRGIQVRPWTSETQFGAGSRQTDRTSA